LSGLSEILNVRKTEQTNESKLFTTVMMSVTKESSILHLWLSDVGQ